MAGIDLVGARVDLVGARVLPALSSLAACTRPWWPRTTTTARIRMPPPHANTACIITTACGPSGGRRELVRMWPPEFWKELAWWPTGARSDVARRGSGGARVVVVLRSVSIVMSVDERQR